LNLNENLSASQSFVETRIVPVYTTYRAFVKNHECDFRACISDKLGPAQPTLDPKTTGYLLLVDGVDEAFNQDSADLKALMSALDSARDTQHINVLFATRPLRLLERECYLVPDDSLYCWLSLMAVPAWDSAILGTQYSFIHHLRPRLLLFQILIQKFFRQFDESVVSKWSARAFMPFKLFYSLVLVLL
jgi:hypothetical protein